MKQKNSFSRYEKKHSFFYLEEDTDNSSPGKPKYIAKVPSVIGKTKLVSFGSRFQDQDYTQQLHAQNSGTEARKSLVVKILPVKSGPKNVEEQTSQSLYIAKFIKADVSLDLELNNFIEKVDQQKYSQLYNQNFQAITSVEEVKNITKAWAADFNSGEVISRHILLSVGGKEDKNKILAVTKLYLEDVFRNKGYEYIFAGHYDTENYHFHVIVKKKNNLGQNLRFSKNDTFILRQKYADYLEKVGIKRQILARKDQKKIIDKLETREEHLKNNNTWYQSKLNKGNQKDYNAYNFKANVAGRIEEEINVLKVKSFLKNTLNVENENLLNRLRSNLKKNGLDVTLDSLLAVKQMQDKQMKIGNLEGLIIGAVEKKFKANKVAPSKAAPEEIKKEASVAQKQKIYVPEFTQDEIKTKFKEAATNYFTNQATRQDLGQNLDKVIEQAFAKPGSKIRFGEKKSCEIVWYGEAGYVLDYRSGELLKWGKGMIKHDESHSYKEVDLEQQQLEQKINQEKISQEKAEARKLAAEKAQALFAKYNDQRDESQHYFRNKGIDDLEIKNIKFHLGQIVIPVMDDTGKIHSLQYIAQDAGKKFLTNGQKKGNFFLLQDKKDAKSLAQESTIYLAEGLATAATIHKATGKNVVVCFDAGNIENVVANLIEKFPGNKYVIFADNDLWKETNTGREKAAAIVRNYQDQIDIKVLLPQFTLEHRDQAPTDFNDLQQLNGLEEVKRQINEGLQKKITTERAASVKLDEAKSQDEIMIEELKKLKAKIVDEGNKQIVKKEVDDTLKILKNINENYAKSVSEKINNDEIKYSYVKPKQEVKNLDKMKQEVRLKADEGLKLS